MEKFTLTIDKFGNDSMGETTELQVKNTIRLLQETIKRIQKGQLYGKIMDENGNSVGQWEFVENDG